jgi:hypothetical protein
MAVYGRVLTPKEKIMPKVIFNRLLQGWFIVRGPHHTPIGGRYPTRAAALARLKGATK